MASSPVVVVAVVPLHGAQLLPLNANARTTLNHPKQTTTKRNATKQTSATMPYTVAHTHTTRSTLISTHTHTHPEHTQHTHRAQANRTHTHTKHSLLSIHTLRQQQRVRRGGWMDGWMRGLLQRRRGEEMSNNMSGIIGMFCVPFSNHNSGYLLYYLPITIVRCFTGASTQCAQPVHSLI